MAATRRKKKRSLRRAERQLSFDEWAEAVEEQIYAEQVQLIRHERGNRAADMANYGWGVSVGKDYISIATKVYGRHPLVLTSGADYPTFEIVHDWDEY